MNTYPTVPTRVSALPDGTALSRYLMTLGESRGDSHKALMVAERWRDTPQVKATFELSTKAAVAPGTTSDATWAGSLAVHGIAGEALQLLRGASILGALEGRFRRVPFRTTVARETGNGAGDAWVGENLSTPVAATAFDAVSQEAYKASVIVVLSHELLRLGDPAAERSVRESVIAGVGAFLDSQLLANSITLISGVRPAAVTNGDGGDIHGHNGRANECRPGRAAGSRDHAGAARLDHATRHRVSHRRDHWRDRGGERAAHVVRHSAGAFRQQSRANRAARPVADFVFRHRRHRHRIV